MKIFFPSPLLLTTNILLLFAACSYPRHAVNSIAATTFRNNINLLAWNEDSLHSHKLAFTKNNLFFYNITELDDTTKKEQYYRGTYKYTADTVFLEYDKDLRPAGAKKFLVKEASGNYLIENFTTGKTRIFFRIQRLNHWFY